MHLRLLALTFAAWVVALPPPTAAASREEGAASSRARTWYVRAGDDTPAAGTRRRPFHSLADVERASRRGDTIVVLPAAPGVRPLDGGIALKRRQRLIGRWGSRITNTSAERHHGDAVVLADGATVRGLEIAGAHRGAIYGNNVTGVRILDNDVSRHNVSCAEGFHIPPFIVPTTLPGVGLPISEGLSNGWAGIMVDADRGRGRVRIAGNRVHDAHCGDGIDIRLSGTARYRADITRNVVERLEQGPDLESVLAIGLQTTERSRLTARLDRNVQTDLGNVAEPNVLVAGADTEGIFVNAAGPSRLHVSVTRNRYTNPRGLGGFSANGMEMVSMGDGPHTTMTIRDSTFTGTPGDVLEQLALGTNAVLDLTLTDVVAARSVGFGYTHLIPGNNGDCMLAGSGGAGNVLRLRVRRSTFSGCANNGLTVGSNVVNGSGSTEAIDVEVADSVITGNRGGNLVIGNYAELRRLSVKVEDTDLSDSQGRGSGRANIMVQELGTTAHAAIDLGGGPLGSRGGNCIAGGTLAADVLRHEVAARGNWWGAPSGPAPGRTLAVGGTLAYDPVLTSAPPSCRSDSSATTSR